MNTSKEKLEMAFACAMESGPQTGGFPFLAECLRKVGVAHNIWSLPAAQSVYVFSGGDSVVRQDTPLFIGVAGVPAFDGDALRTAIRREQSGESTFEEFLHALWNAGVWAYDVHFEKREVMYMGAKGDFHTEAYPQVEVPDFIS